MDRSSEVDAIRASRKPARRGFAAMSPERQREIARKGGHAAHRAGTAHEFTAEEARAAGRKGGLEAQRRKGSVIAPAPAEGDARGQAPSAFEEPSPRSGESARG
jgi:general stress protein YciG